MAWLCVDKSKEYISEDKPIRHEGVLRFGVFAFEDSVISLPEGSIKRLIGRELTWEDEPVKFTEPHHQQTTWVKYDINDESTWPPLESGSGIHSIRVITNGGDICQFIHSNKRWVYLLNYEINPVTHWAPLPVYIK